MSVRDDPVPHQASVAAALDADVVHPGTSVTLSVRVWGGVGPLRLIARLLVDVCVEPHPGADRDCVTLEMGTPEIALVAAPASGEDEVAFTLEVPPDAPASATGLVDWRVALRVEHRDGDPIELTAAMTVVGTGVAPRRPGPSWADRLPDASDCRLELDVEQPYAAPGSRICGVLRASLGEGLRGGGWDVAVRLVGVWRRRDPAREEVLLQSATCRPWPEPAEQPRPGRSYLFPFAVDLAADAPPSFDAGITALDWYVLAECAWGEGREAPDRCAAAQPVHVGPDAVGFSRRHATGARGARLDPTPHAGAGSTPTG